MGERERCPLSGIGCRDCGYYGVFSTCFLRDLIEVLEHVDKVLEHVGEVLEHVGKEAP